MTREIGEVIEKRFVISQERTVPVTYYWTYMDSPVLAVSQQRHSMSKAQSS